MPNFKGINLSLVSQFDILTLPEYAPPEVPVLDSKDDPKPETSIPPLLDSSERVVSVYIPIYPSSMFWLSYQVQVPLANSPFYYFKLFLNGEHVVSWGCSKRENFKGKAAFGLFESERSHERPARRLFSFASEEGAGAATQEGSEAGVLEVRVFRALGRRKAKPHLIRLPREGKGKRILNGKEAILLKRGGDLPKNHPQDYYQYALRDPTDVPFVIFRYLPRHLSELEDLGITSGLSTSHSSISVKGEHELMEDGGLSDHSDLIRQLSDLSILKPQMSDTTTQSGSSNFETESSEQLDERGSEIDALGVGSLSSFASQTSHSSASGHASILAKTSFYSGDNISVGSELPKQQQREENISPTPQGRTYRALPVRKAAPKPIDPHPPVAAGAAATPSAVAWPKTILRTAITRLLESRISSSTTATASNSNDIIVAGEEDEQERGNGPSTSLSPPSDTEASRYHQRSGEEVVSRRGETDEL